MQPTFLPWIGYFSMIDRCDAFVYLDSVQFNKRSWQQRNQIKTSQGPLFITMPVLSKGKQDQIIRDVQINVTENPIPKLINTIKSNYGKAPFFKQYSEAIFDIFQSHTNLNDLNMAFIGHCLKVLGIEKKIYRSSEMKVEGAKADLLVSICQSLNAKSYLSAPGSREYIEESQAFEAAGISVHYHMYQHPQYKQLWGDFQPYMSFLDLLFNEGENSLAILRSGV